MREIKFRAWIKQSEHMVQQVGIDPYHVNDLDRFHWNHDQVELMQFTGLHDKNGKEIYEGDIIIDLLTKMKSVIKFGFCLKYAFTGWFVENPNMGYVSMVNNDSSESNNSNIEIIGNIYENPELLKS